MPQFSTFIADVFMDDLGLSCDFVLQQKQNDFEDWTLLPLRSQCCLKGVMLP